MNIANPPICFFIVTEAAITHHTHFVLSFLHLALNNLFPIHQTPIITLLWKHFLKAWKQSDHIELISVQNVSLENQFVNISIITITKDRILFSVIVHRHIKKANISATKAFISLINRTAMVRNLEFIWNNFVFWPVLQKVFDKRKKRLQSRLNKRFENKNHLLIEHKRFRFGRWFRWLPLLGSNQRPRSLKHGRAVVFAAISPCFGGLLLPWVCCRRQPQDRRSR